MAFFIYEHLTSGALIDADGSASLLHEGDVMLQAIITDLLAFDCEILTLRDTRLPTLPAHPSLTVIPVKNRQDYNAAWLEGITSQQPVLIIAPEKDAVLFQLTQQAEANQCPILGCHAEAVLMTGDKWRCYQQLTAHQILTPETILASDWQPDTCATQTQHWVIKPIDGAGCEHTYKFDNQAMQQYLLPLSEPALSNAIIQPYIAGMPLSLSLFIADSTISVYSINQQQIVEHHQTLSLSHCLTKQQHLLDDDKAMQLAQAVVAAIPGLNGFVGIDLIKQDDKLWVVDINPRLTSSYAEAAMRKNDNPAKPLYQQIIANT